MSFDWAKFLDDRGIEYAERGPSTAKGNLYVHCPFCGADDQGRHMGVSIEGRGWGCWKNTAHRGRAPERLIQALIGVSWAEASRIAGRRAGGLPSGAGGLLAAVQGMLDVGPPEPPRDPPQFPKEVRRLSPSPHAQFIWNYLAIERQYRCGEIEKLTKRFDLRYAMTGDWSYRLVIPVYDEQTRLVTWSGRAISDNAKVRYKTLTSDPDKAGDGPLAIGPITDYLLGLPDLFHGGKFLVLGEGQFDAFRLSIVADLYDAKASCLFGKVAGDAQLDLLAQLKDHYEAIFLLLDPDAMMDSIALGAQMRAIGVIPIPLEGQDDPDEMRADRLVQLFDKMARKADQMRR